MNDQPEATLASQIMDELMDQPMTATQLCRELGAAWVDVVTEMIALKRNGLIAPTGTVRRGEEVPFKMVHTRKVPA